jgi:hypothetical protein
MTASFSATTRTVGGRRASTDGRYGSWNDGKLFNYRKFEVWEWLERSITTLIERFDVRRHPLRFGARRSHHDEEEQLPFGVRGEARSEEGLEGGIVVNDREDGHFVTTGYYDSAAATSSRSAALLSHAGRGEDAPPTRARFFHQHSRVLLGPRALPYARRHHPYNSALFKICENIIHGATDVREIYHIYDTYFPR